MKQADPDLIDLQNTYVLDVETTTYHDNASGTTLREKSFNDLHAHKLDGVPHRRFTQSKFSAKMTRADYLPGQNELVIEESGRLVLNTYVPAGCVAVPGDCSLILDHIRWLLPDPTDHNHIFNILAHLIQFPGEKITSGVLLLGPQGSGKSWIFNLAVRLLGEKNCWAISSPELDTDWRYDWGNRQFALIEEVAHHGKMEAANSLKEWLTADTIMANQKNVPLSKVRTPRFIIATSNSIAPLHLEYSDRRWAVLKSPQAKREPTYYNMLFSEGLAQAPAFKAWLLERDLSDYNSKAPPPMTKAKAELIDDSRPPVTAAVHRLIKDGEISRVFTLEDVAKKLSAVGTYVTQNDKKLVYAVRECNCIKIDSQVRVDGGKKVRLWLLPDAAGLKDLAPRKLAEIYNEPKDKLTLDQIMVNAKLAQSLPQSCSSDGWVN